MSEVVIAEVPPNQRAALLPILKESFDGWYLRHSTSTLREIEVVKSAAIGSEVAGLTMLKMLNPSDGYVYYIAVARKFRGTGVGGRLLDESLSYLRGRGASRVYASIGEDNPESRSLFESRGFASVTFSQLKGDYGIAGALNMYRKMVVVPGENLLSLKA